MAGHANHCPSVKGRCRDSPTVLAKKCPTSPTSGQNGSLHQENEPRPWWRVGGLPSGEQPENQPKPSSARPSKPGVPDRRQAVNSEKGSCPRLTTFLISAH